MNTGSVSEAGGANIFSTANNKAKFGDNPFLQLLIKQMQTQTPLDPVDNDSFMTQMSQFSSMEQQKEMNENLLNLLEFQGALARLQGLSQGTAMIGKEVDYVPESGKGLMQGVVESVRVNERGDIIMQIGKKDIPLAAIVGVRDAPEPKGKDKSSGGGKDA